MSIAEWIGLGASVVGGTIMGIYKVFAAIDKAHRQERNEWRGSMERQFDKIGERDQRNESLLVKISTLIENQSK